MQKTPWVASIHTTRNTGWSDRAYNNDVRKLLLPERINIRPAGGVLVHFITRMQLNKFLIAHWVLIFWTPSWSNWGWVQRCIVFKCDVDLRFLELEQEHRKFKEKEVRNHRSPWVNWSFPLIASVTCCRSDGDIWWSSDVTPFLISFIGIVWYWRSTSSHSGLLCAE